MYCPFPYLYSDYYLHYYYPQKNNKKQKKTKHFTSHSFRTFKTITASLRSEIVWRWRRMGTDKCNHGITYNIYNILTDHINIAVDMFILYSTPSNRLAGNTLVPWIFWPDIVEWTNFDNMLTCEIDGEVTDFLHDGILWDGNM